MIKRFCDWCGDEIPDDQLYSHRGGTTPFLLSSTSDLTGKRLSVHFIVGTNGVSNTGDYHVLCVLRMLVHQEAVMRQDQEKREHERRLATFQE